MQDTTKCPYCNIDLEFDDVSEQIFSENRYIDLCIGHCPQCKKNFRWEETFERISVDKVREGMQLCY